MTDLCYELGGHLGLPPGAETLITLYCLTALIDDERLRLSIA